MPKLSDLLAEKAKGEVQIGGATVNFTFHVMVRERFSDDEWTELLALRGRDYLKRLLPQVLTSWDIVDDGGSAIPITAEGFDQYGVPDALLLVIERRVFQSDLAGKVPTSNNSPGT